MSKGKNFRPNADNKVHDIESEKSNQADEDFVTEQETHQQNHLQSAFPRDSKLDKKQRKKRALLEFSCLVEDAIRGNYLIGKPNKEISFIETIIGEEQLAEITLWNVPLLPSKGHQGTEIILMKFLKHCDFKVVDAFKLLRRTLIWRKEYEMEEKPEPEIENVLSVNGSDRDGRPLYFNSLGAFRNRDLCEKVFGSEFGCEKLLRWKIESMEKGIKKLDFRPGGVDSLVQITDLQNFRGMNDLPNANKKYLISFHEHYPELIHRYIIINAPFWYYASHVVFSKLMSQRTKKKFVFARPHNATATLLKYISPENLPIEYGGLKRENDTEFSHEDKVEDAVNVKPNSTKCIEIPIEEVGVTTTWDLTVVGWEVSYKEEFIPNDEGSYKVLLNSEKEKKGTQSIRNSFYINEPGKIVITIDNPTYNNKKVIYRYKTKPTIPIYTLLQK